jgi:hypothetical protein
MGNRAVITFDKKLNPNSLGIYLHWNGGRDSVQAFLDATRELMKSRGPDSQYAPARLVQVIGNFIGGSLSLGLSPLSQCDTDNGDNGTYVVDPESLQIVARKHVRHGEQNKKEHYEGVYAECIEKNKAIFKAE